MKILLTGSNGLLGQKLVHALRNKAEVELIATSRGENRLKEKTGYTYQALDITKADEVQQCMAKHQPDVIINTAAMTNVDACEHDKAGCDALNVEAVAHLVRACESQGIHLVHLSTDFIFNGEHGPLSEEEEPDPLSYYGWSKLKAEQLITQSTIKSAILRTVLVYGVAEEMSRSNIVLWAKSSLEAGKPIRVVDDQFRTPTLAEDLAQACILAAMQGASGIYHISGPDFMGILELVERVADFWKLDKSLISPLDSSTLNQAAKRPPKTGFIIDKAVRELGYTPHSFEDGLALVDAQLSS